MVKANLSIYQNIADCIAGRGGGEGGRGGGGGCRGSEGVSCQ